MSRAGYVVVTFSIALGVSSTMKFLHLCLASFSKDKTLYDLTMNVRRCVVEAPCCDLIFVNFLHVV